MAKQKVVVPYFHRRFLCPFHLQRAPKVSLNNRVAEMCSKLSEMW